MYFHSRPYSPLDTLCHQDSTDSPDRSQSATPGLEIPPMDLLNEMQDLFQRHQIKTDTMDLPPIDRSVSDIDDKKISNQ